MMPIRLLFLLTLSATAFSHAQDKPEDGRSTLRFGYYTEPSGQVQPARYELFDDGESLRVSLALYGKSPVDLPVLAYDRKAGTLELGWTGHPDRRCRLDRVGENAFTGNCVEGGQVMPIVIREGTREDAEFMGRYLDVSVTDVQIIVRASEIFAGQESRNTDDDRDCEDGRASGSVSLFCALYVASIEVAGTYRHWRPAMKAVRMELVNRFSGEHSHLLRDINNNAAIPDEDLLEVLESARARLDARLGNDP